MSPLEKLFASWEPGDRSMFVPSFLDETARWAHDYRDLINRLLACPPECHCQKNTGTKYVFETAHRVWNGEGYLQKLDRARIEESPDYSRGYEDIFL